jgi:hypothetical protein
MFTAIRVPELISYKKQGLDDQRTSGCPPIARYLSGTARIFIGADRIFYLGT